MFGLARRNAALVAPLATCSLLLGPFAIASATAAPSPDVVNSEVYGGGGNSGATFTHDFIELYNRGADPVNLSGWSLQYASRDPGHGTPLAVRRRGRQQRSRGGLPAHRQRLLDAGPHPRRRHRHQ